MGGNACQKKYLRALIKSETLVLKFYYMRKILHFILLGYYVLSEPDKCFQGKICVC